MKLRTALAATAATVIFGSVLPTDAARAQSLPETRVAQSPTGTVVPAEYPKLRMGLATAPRGAPNIVVVLLDDVGFAASSTFGGAIETPTLQALADAGLRYNRFHTTAICSPTRASLLTGRNPHAVGVGAVLNTPAAYPGYAGVLPRSAATVAEVLRQNGYGTAAFGKWHLAPEWESSPAGPYDHWPLRQGFDHFYGFLPAETDQFAPTLVQDQSYIPTPRRPGYHLTEDLADQAIGWMQRHRSATPDRPFFVYFAPGAAHAPLQVPASWIARYKGRFAQGWDRLREESFARQKRLGVIPADAVLTPRPADLPSWDSLSADERRIAERYMETYAGFLAHTDAQIGRLREALAGMGALDDTLFVYIVGDNGASGEGGPYGSIRYMARVQGVPEKPTDALAVLDAIGGPKVHAHYNAGWAWALDTPFQWMKQIASHLGGIRNPMVVSWPARIKDQGGLRPQFAFVSDIAPTLLEAAGIAAPASVNGVAQQPIDGLSLLPTFDDAKAPAPRRTQYFNVFGNRAIYHDGWMASAYRGRTPWNVRNPITKSPLEDRWELYDLDADFSQSRDLAAQNPAKLAELQALFWSEAGRNQVLPLIDNTQTAGLPMLHGGRAHHVFYQGSRGIPEVQAPPTVMRSHTITAKLDLGTQRKGGVVAAFGGVAGGWALHVDARRRPVYVYNYADTETYRLVGDRPLPAGASTVAVALDYDKPMTGGAATAVMTVDGRPAGRLRIPHTVPFLFSIHETMDIGTDLGGPVAPDYAPGSEFDGVIREVAIDIR